MEEQYPISCPFCTIAETYPSAESATSDVDANSLKRCVPENVDIEKLQPACFLILSSPEVLAFLDIQPMTLGHLLVVTRSHQAKLEDVPGNEAQKIGMIL